MRYLGRGLLLVLLIGILAWCVHTIRPYLTLAWLAPRVSRLDKLHAARKRLVYILHNHDWTVFSLPSGAKRFKVITNANLPSPLPLYPEQAWRYAVEYQVVDAKGQRLQQHTYHHRTRVTRYTHPDRRDVTTVAFYLQDTVRPADARTMVVNLALTGSAVRLRLRLAAKDPGVQGVVIRVAALELTAERKLGYLWRRLPPSHKRNLVKGLVYPAEFLRESEKRYLLRHKWRALGPQGIQGRDYHPRTLYVAHDVEGEVVTMPTLPAGRFVDPDHHGIIPIPPDGVDLRLEFLALPAPYTPPGREGIRLLWYGDSPTARATYTVAWNDQGTHVERFFPAGLLEIRVPHGAVVVRALRRAGAQRTDITPEPRYIRTYRVQPNLAVVFDVNHMDGMSTPLRLDVRHLMAMPGQASAPPPHTLTYELLTAQGNVGKSGNVTVSAPVSRYDRVLGQAPETRISDPTSFYFSLPSHIARIRFSLPQAGPGAPLLLAAFNRPPDLVREIRVPDDYGHAKRDDEPQRAWFPIRPRDAQQLMRQRHSLLLALQPRPPETRPDLLSGHYKWEEYHPQGPWRARHLLLPRNPEQPIREDAFAVTYQPLSAGSDTRLTFRTPHGLRSVQPQLIFMRRQSEPLTFRLFVDDALHYRGSIAGKRGEVRLPPITIGPHRLRLMSPAGDIWLINHAAPGSHAYLKRLAHRFDTSGLRFTYERQAAVAETLSVRVYPRYGRKQPLHIRVTIDAPPPAALAPASTWTFTERRFVVHPALGQPASVLNTVAEVVDPGQSFFLPLGSDVPPGRYRIQFHLEKGPSGYLTLAKLTPGAFEHRTVLRDKECGMRNKKRGRGTDACAF